MARLDIERQKLLEPTRIEYAVSRIQELGFEIVQRDNTQIQFIHKGQTVTFFPYSGWATGKSIKDGRGLETVETMKPKGNGLIQLHDEKQEERGFFCMKLVQFLNTEAEMGTDEYKQLWEERFTAAKNGCCSYKDRCPIYERTVKDRPVQLSLFT